MGIRFLVNFGLLALPIAITVGVLLSIQTTRTASGKPPIFAPDNGVKSKEYCQKAMGIHPETKGQEYTLNPNQWNWDEGDPGSLCLNVTTHNNRTYATDFTAPKWSVTWQYPKGPVDDPVHAFPNIMVDGNVFPAKLENIDKVDIDFKWTYGLGSKPVKKTDFDALDDALFNANVAMDIFLDKDRSKAGDSEKAAHEVMVWFASMGTDTQPLGFNVDGSNPTATKELHGTEFKLYVGQNEKGQNVLTWYVDKPAEEFKGDLTPLLNEILSMDRTNFPSPSDYIGYMSWGTETFSVNKEVTFDVPHLSIEIEKSS